MAKAAPTVVTQARAGRYVQQSTGYHAFIPAPLPPNPPVQLGGKLRKLLVSKMEEHGILREFTGQSRNRRFRYEAYIALFADPVTETPEADV